MHYIDTPSTSPSELAKRIRTRLDEIEKHINGCCSCSTCEAHQLKWALRTVLDLHPPRQAGTLTPWDLRCTGCSMPLVTSVDWPCKTVIAIARELGIEMGEDDA